MRNDDIFKTWTDIKAWSVEHGYDLLAKRLQLNNDMWWSSGEFGRSQVAICDAMRSAEDLHEVAAEIEAELASDEVLACV